MYRNVQISGNRYRTQSKPSDKTSATNITFIKIAILNFFVLELGQS